MVIEVNSSARMQELGQVIGSCATGGYVIELVGDIGAGKTTLTKGIANGLGVNEEVQSPTFTISRVYEARCNLTLVHYDFYRLSDPGVIKMELSENVNDKNTVSVIEWSNVVKDVLPRNTLKITITATEQDDRLVEINSDDSRFNVLMDKLHDFTLG